MWHLESIAERDRAMRTFVCIVPETRRRVTTDNGESLQRRERLCAGRSIRLFQCTRAKQTYVKGELEGVMRGQRYCTCAFCPRQLSPFYSFLPCDVTYAISERYFANVRLSGYLANVFLPNDTHYVAKTHR